MRKIVVTLFLSLVFTLFLSSVQETWGQLIKFSQHALKEAMTIQAANEMDLMNRPGVQGIGIGAKNSDPAIVLFINEDSSESQLPTKINGLPVIFKRVKKFVAEQISLGVSGGNDILCSGDINTCNGSGDPGAVCASDSDCPSNQSCVFSSSDFCDVGTVGFKVCDRSNQGRVGFLMNNHVATSGCPGKCPNNTPLGTPIYSPGFFSDCSNPGTSVGTLNRFVDIQLDGITPNDVDAAFIQSSDEEVSCTIQGLGQQGNIITSPVLGLKVCKSGAVTGVTCGEISAINATLQIEYFRVGISSTEPCGTGNGLFRNTFIYSPIPPDTTDMSSGGDSGAPVVGANNNAVGLHFAGGGSDGVALPIGRVLDELDVSLCCSTTTTTVPVRCTADEDCDDDGVYCNGEEICDEDTESCMSTGNPCAKNEICNETAGVCESPHIEASTNAVGSRIFLLPGVVTIRGVGTNFTSLGNFVTYDPPVLLNYFRLLNSNTQTITQFVIVMPSIFPWVPLYPATIRVTVDDLSDDTVIGEFLF
jgi:hypothetical protein